jgi:hypothetical protein
MSGAMGVLSHAGELPREHVRIVESAEHSGLTSTCSNPYPKTKQEFRQSVAQTVT